MVWLPHFEASESTQEAPGSETALEEMMCRVLGDSLQDGTVAKLADDLYCGGKPLMNSFPIGNVSCKPFKSVTYVYQLSAPDQKLFWDGSGQKAVCQLVHTE